MNSKSRAIFFTLSVLVLIGVPASATRATQATSCGRSCLHREAAAREAMSGRLVGRDIGGPRVSLPKSAGGWPADMILE
jgi:hypothetical protein